MAFWVQPHGTLLCTGAERPDVRELSVPGKTILRVINNELAIRFYIQSRLSIMRIRLYCDAPQYIDLFILNFKLSAFIVY